MSRNQPDKDKWFFLQALATGLRQQPAYLLIFAISALFFLFGLGSGVSAAVSHEPQLWYLAFGGLLASLIAAVLVVRNVHPLPVLPTRPVEIRQEHTAGTYDPKSDDVLRWIQDNVNEALKLKNETFREAVLQECNEFRDRTSNWSNGRILAASHYNKLLVTFYERAKESVFSTNIPNYLPTWSTDFGDHLMDAHHKSRASVTRVFVFNKRIEVTPEAVQVMERQSKAGIHVRVHFSDESALFSFPPDISKDFTVIDHGEAIGTTISFGGDSLTAEWYVQDSDKKPRFEGMCSSLTQASEEFPKFHEWWRKNAAGF